ncbi:MAG: hypothetical protein H8D49_01385 [Dehalococcoidia bacterium]|nr:hypothetical protein [Dehalococcoidia bacterium]
MIKPQVIIEKLEMEDPTFEAGVSKTAQARLSNPTAKQFTYTVELYLGVTKEATSGVGTVTIPANSYLDVNFTLVMPLVEGTHPVYLDVWHEGTLLKHYQATEDVVIQISPDIDVGPITWA